jgi:RNA polymerase sigma-70 factor, ECF subfamily
MKHSDEQDLLNRARMFDKQALAVIYDRYNQGLFAYAMRLVGDRCQAEDIVSETFSRFLKALHAGQGPEAYLQAYLYRVAHNCVVDLYRRQPAAPVVLSDELQDERERQPEAQADDLYEKDQVRMALRMLTPEQRQVILLRFYEDWENEEVSAAVQKPVGAVRALQHRAIGALRRWLLKDYHEEESYELEDGI